MYVTYYSKFQKTTFQLKDINECTSGENNNCHDNAICTNTYGSFTCQCQNGYTGNGITCNGKQLNYSIVKEFLSIDINECSSEGDNNCHDNAICTNTYGNYTCQCQIGYTGNGITCNGKQLNYSIVKEFLSIDINECSSEGDNNCHDNAICTNTYGNYTCQCQIGYTGNGITCNGKQLNYSIVKEFLSIDINECSSEGDNNCHDNAICTNTYGSFTCQCQNGYTGNGITCNGKQLNYSIVKEFLSIDINECSSEGDNNCHDNAICTNTYGNYTCQCQNGYTGNGITCNGKQLNNSIVKEFLSIDINECSSKGDNNCHDNAICTNTYGSYTCQCESGYTGNGTTCNGKQLTNSIIKEFLSIDVNECSNTGDNNCHENAICTNTYGSYTCQCQNGYKGNGITCNGK